MIGRFALDKADYVKMGRMIRRIPPEPIVVTQEGGYDMTAVPEIVCGFLSGLLTK